MSPSFSGLINRLKNKAVNNSLPSVVHIEVCSECNLECAICPIRQVKRAERYMRFDLFKKIIKEISILKIPFVRLFMLGEPLLHPRLINMIKLCKDNKINMVDIDTNGLLLNKEIAIKLLNSGLDRITFSIDAATANTYRKVRNSDKFPVLIENIDSFIKEKKVLCKQNPKLMVSFVENILNKGEKDPFVSFWKTKEIDYIYTSHVKSYSGRINLSCYELPGKQVPCWNVFKKIVIFSDGRVSICCLDFNGEYSKNIVKIYELLKKQVFILS